MASNNYHQMDNAGHDRHQLLIDALNSGTYMEYCEENPPRVNISLPNIPGLRQELCIDQVESENNDGTGSESGLSEFDEHYYAMLPPPIPRSEMNIVYSKANAEYSYCNRFQDDSTNPEDESHSSRHEFDEESWTQETLSEINIVSSKQEATVSNPNKSEGNKSQKNSKKDEYESYFNKQPKKNLKKKKKSKTKQDKRIYENIHKKQLTPANKVVSDNECTSDEEPTTKDNSIKEDICQGLYVGLTDCSKSNSGWSTYDEGFWADTPSSIPQKEMNINFAKLKQHKSNPNTSDKEVETCSEAEEYEKFSKYTKAKTISTREIPSTNKAHTICAAAKDKSDTENKFTSKTKSASVEKPVSGNTSSLKDMKKFTLLETINCEQIFEDGIHSDHKTKHTEKLKKIVEEKKATPAEVLKVPKKQMNKLKRKQRKLIEKKGKENVEFKELTSTNKFGSEASQFPCSTYLQTINEDKHKNRNGSVNQRKDISGKASAMAKRKTDFKELNDTFTDADHYFMFYVYIENTRLDSTELRKSVYKSINENTPNWSKMPRLKDLDKVYRRKVGNEEIFYSTLLGLSYMDILMYLAGEFDIYWMDGLPNNQGRQLHSMIINRIHKNYMKVSPNIPPDIILDYVFEDLEKAREYMRIRLGLRFHNALEYLHSSELMIIFLNIGVEWFPLDFKPILTYTAKRAKNYVPVKRNYLEVQDYTRTEYYLKRYNLAKGYMKRDFRKTEYLKIDLSLDFIQTTGQNMISINDIILDLNFLENICEEVKKIDRPELDYLKSDYLNTDYPAEDYWMLEDLHLEPKCPFIPNSVLVWESKLIVEENVNYSDVVVVVEKTKECRRYANHPGTGTYKFFKYSQFIIILPSLLIILCLRILSKLIKKVLWI